MKAKDIMVPLKDYLDPDTTVKKAVNLLRTVERKEQKYAIMGLPVVDKAGKLTGMLSMTDILKAAYPAYMKMADLSEFTWDGMLESLAKQEGDKKVKEIMTSPAISTEENNPLMECVDLLLKNNIRQMPVVNKAGNVVGILSINDIFYAVTKSMIEK